MSAHRILFDLGLCYATQNHILMPPSPGGTINQAGRGFALVRLPAGAYKLPDDGLPMYVQTTGAAVIRSAAGTTVATLASGAYALFLPTSSTTWTVAFSSISSGYIALPLTGWREVSSNDITNAAGNGGVLATDTTPALEYVNGDTDSQIRILWAAGNADPIACQVTLPPDLDRTRDVVLHMRALSGGLNDSPVMDIDTFFDEGDAKVSDATDLIQDNIVNASATIAAADIPADATTMSLEMTPGAHASETLAVFATWITYTRKFA